MGLKERLKNDLKEAMREKQIVKRDAIRAINTLIKQVEVDQRIELDDAKIIELIQKGIKQREEAIVQYKKASRDDLVQKEQEQIDIFSLYLPKQLSDTQLEDIIKELILKTGANSMKDMGKIVNLTKEKVTGGADGKRISRIVKKMLG